MRRTIELAKVSRPSFRCKYSRNIYNIILCAMILGIILYTRRRLMTFETDPGGRASGGGVSFANPETALRFRSV